MKEHMYMIRYSTFFEGEESPHELPFPGKDVDEAKSKLKKFLQDAGTEEYYIGEALLIK